MHLLPFSSAVFSMAVLPGGEMKNKLFAELRAQLKRLPFVAPPTRKLIENAFREGCNPKDIRHYMNIILPFLEKIHECGKTSDFKALSDRIAAMTGQAEVMAEFGLREYTWSEWFLAQNREVEDVRQKYCLTNGIALRLFRWSEYEQTPSAQAWHLYENWQQLFQQRKDYQRAIVLLENWLQLGPQSYQPQTLPKHLEQRFQEIFTDTALRIIDALADSLAQAKRDSDQRIVLEAMLLIEDNLYSDRATLQRHLDPYSATWQPGSQIGCP